MRFEKIAQAANQRPQKNEPVVFLSNPKGLNTILPERQLSKEDLSTCKNFKLIQVSEEKQQGIILASRPGVKKVTTATTGGNAIKEVAQISLDGTMTFLLVDSSNQLYKCSGTEPSLDPGSVVATLAGEATILPFGDKAVLLDGGYIKVYDGSSVTLAYDDGTGTRGYQIDNTSLSESASDAVDLYSGANTKAGIRFQAQLWDVGYTIDITQVNVSLSKTGSPTGNCSIEIYEDYHYNIGEATDASSTLDASAKDQDLRGFVFNNDGTKGFFVGTQNNKIYEYSLSTPYDVSSGSYTTDYDVSGELVSPSDLKFNSDGTKFFVSNRAIDYIHEYSLGSAYDLSGTVTYSQASSEFTEITQIDGFAFNNDGTKLFLADTFAADGNVLEYSLIIAFDTSTVIYTQSIDVSSHEVYASGIVFNNDGSKLFITGTNSDSIHEFYLQTVFDISTATHRRTLDISGTSTKPMGLAFNSDGSNIYFIDENNAVLHTYSMSMGASLGSSSDLDVTTLTTSGVVKEFSFSSSITLYPYYKYFAVVEYSGGDGSNYITVHAADNTDSDGEMWYYDGSWNQTTGADPLIAVKPGKPPKASFGVLKGSRLYLAGDPDNAGRIWYSNVQTIYDWSTADGGGYIDAIGYSAGAYPIGGLVTHFENLLVFGKSKQPYLAILSGDSPSEFEINQSFQQVWTNHQSLVSIPNSVWYSSSLGTQRIVGTQEYGDLRSRVASEVIRDTIRDNWSTDAIAGYLAKDGLYVLKLAGYTDLLVGHAGIVDKPWWSKQIVAPWTAWTLANSVTPVCFFSGGDYLYFGGDDGHLYRFDESKHQDEDANGDDNDLAFTLKTGVYDSPFGTTHIKDYYTNVSRDVTSFNLKFFTDGSGTADMTIAVSPENAIQQGNVEVVGDSLQMQLDTFVITDHFYVKNIVLQSRKLQRRLK